jgi:hypothetical protein
MNFTRPSLAPRSLAGRILRVGAALGISVAVLADDCSSCPGNLSNAFIPVTPVTIAFTTTPPATVAPGSSGVLSFQITRTSTDVGDVPIAVDPALTGLGTAYVFSTDTVTVLAGQTTGQITYHVSADAPVSSTVYSASGLHTVFPGTVPAKVAWSFLVLQPGSFVISGRSDGKIQPGAVDTFTISIVRQGFTAPITFSAPTVGGVTLSFTPSSTSANSVLVTERAATSAPVGNAALTITAASAGATTRTLPYLAIVSNDTYTLTAAPSPVSIVRGGSGVVTATVAVPFVGAPATSITGSSATAGITVSPVTTPGTTFASQSVSVPVAVDTSVAPGTYTVTLTSVAEAYLDVHATFQVQVLPAQTGSYSINVQTAPLTVAAGTTVGDIVQILRTNFPDSVLITATTPTGIHITPNPVMVGTANVTLGVSVDSGTAAGTYSVALKGTSVGHPDTTTTFAVIVPAPVTNTTPVGLVLTPTGTSGAPFHMAINATQDFTAYLVDAQGHITAPETGWRIGTATDLSSVAQVTSSSYSATTMQMTIHVRALGNGSTALRAFYEPIGSGQSTYSGVTIIAVP